MMSLTSDDRFNEDSSFDNCSGKIFKDQRKKINNNNNKKNL